MIDSIVNKNSSKTMIKTNAVFTLNLLQNPKANKIVPKHIIPPIVELMFEILPPKEVGQNSPIKDVKKIKVDRLSLFIAQRQFPSSNFFANKFNRTKSTTTLTLHANAAPTIEYSSINMNNKKR